MIEWVVKPIGAIATLVPRPVALRVYRVPWAARAIRGLLNACVPPGLREVRVVGGALRGRRLLLDLSREKYLWLGTYEPWVQDVILRIVRPGSRAWDIGAFIGYHTLLMHRRAGGGRVVAFEPDPANRVRLQANLSLNDANDVVVVPAAVGAVGGNARLSRTPSHPGETKIAENGHGDCQVVTLDALLGRLSPPHFIKVDVEGAETDVLRGAREILRRHRPTWLLEIHGAKGADAIDLLHAARYQVTRLGKGVDVDANLPVGGPAHVLAVPA